jgi:hypothetical protein
MPSIFSRLKGKDGPTKVKAKKGSNLDQLASQLPPKPRWEDAFTRTSVEPDEVQELIRRCTEELKSRCKSPTSIANLASLLPRELLLTLSPALDHPFLLLPFRPTSDPSAVRTFIRHFFDGNQILRGEALLQELRMAEPMVNTIRLHVHIGSC